MLLRCYTHSAEWQSNRLLNVSSGKIMEKGNYILLWYTFHMHEYIIGSRLCALGALQWGCCFICFKSTWSRTRTQYLQFHIRKRLFTRINISSPSYPYEIVRAERIRMYAPNNETTTADSNNRNAQHTRVTIYALCLRLTNKCNDILNEIYSTFKTWICDVSFSEEKIDSRPNKIAFTFELTVQENKQHIEKCGMRAVFGDELVFVFIFVAHFIGTSSGIDRLSMAMSPKKRQNRFRCLKMNSIRIY